MDALRIREAAAIDLARKGLIDGALALSFIVWPTEAVEAASEAVAAEGAVRGRTARGRGCGRSSSSMPAVRGREAARLVGVPKGTLGTWVRMRQRACD